MADNSGLFRGSLVTLVILCLIPSVVVQQRWKQRRGFRGAG